MTTRALPAADPWALALEAFRAPDREPAFVRAFRAAGAERFRAAGFPATSDEEWRATNVQPIARGRFGAAPSVPPAPPASVLHPWLLGESVRLTFVDGCFVPSLSAPGHLPSEVRLLSLRAALAECPELVEPHLGRLLPARGHGFLALQAALFRDGAFLHLPRGHCLTTPIHLLHLASGEAGLASHPRHLIVLGESAHATVIESYAPLTPGASFTNAATEISLAPNASVDHYRLQCEAESAFHHGALAVHQERDSNAVLTSLSFGGALVRNEAATRLDGPGAACTMHGLALASGRRHVDNHTRIVHARPQCESRELYKTILAGRATGVFHGRIHVLEDAQRTDAKQSNHALLLSGEASIDARPQLEIFADDVKCTHGATVGRLDEDALFYLRARGIPRESARAMLVGAFAADVTGQIRVAPTRERVERLVAERLPAAGGAA